MQIKLNQKQLDYVKSKKINTGFVAGLGSGKSFAATLKTIIKKIENPKLTVAYYLPTYPLIKDIAFAKFPEMLSDMGIEYKLNKSDKEIHIPDHGKIIFRSMDTPENIVGYEVFFSIIDECDILNAEKMEIAYNKIMARNRQKHPDNKPNELDIVGTPEGFKFFYKRFVSEFREETDLLITASTYENKHLPKEYISNLEAQYPPNLIKAYLMGEFINLTSGTVYSYFDRSKHNTYTEATENDVINLGQDFNVGGCVSIAIIVKEDKIFVVDEFSSKDTFEVAPNVRKVYSKNQIVCYPDASGRSGSSNANKTDIEILQDAGFLIDAPKANGRIIDSVNAINSLFMQNRLFINTNKCPNLTRALEQQAYDKNGEPEKFAGAATLDDYADALRYPIVRKFPLVTYSPITGGFNR